MEPEILACEIKLCGDPFGRAFLHAGLYVGTLEHGRRRRRPGARTVRACRTDELKSGALCAYWTFHHATISRSIRVRCEVIDEKLGGVALQIGAILWQACRVLG